MIPPEQTLALRTELLGWYDRHRRRLPWRALPGESADPYRVWLSEIMLQQTTVAAVGPYFLKFLKQFPDLAALAAAPQEQVLRLWAGLGYYSRARNLHACAQAVTAEHGGRFPASATALRTLPGIGAYTANAIASIAFDLPVVPMDGNVERVLTRLFAVSDPLPGAKPAIQKLADAFASTDRPGDFAQALMDLGATICTPKRPACALCPWRDDCRAHALGQAEAFPVKGEKGDRPQRFGAAFIIRRRGDGAVLLRRRAEKGLLGGMTEVPTSHWSDSAAEVDATPPCGEDFRPGGTVRHVFTHFALTLTVLTAEVDGAMELPPGAYWAPPADLAGEALPTLFRKVLAAGLGEDPMRRQRGPAGRFSPASS